MATFSDFYAKQVADLKKAQPSASPSFGVNLDALPTMTAPEAESGPMSFLNKAVDLLSRPLYGVTNTVSAIRDDLLAANDAADQGDVGGAAGHYLKTLADVPGGFLQGFFNTGNDKKLKRTFSDVIEQSTDEIGKRVDPDYVDTQDNVNPWLKGLTGFALDVVGDPLTWIPGGQIGKIGEIAGRAIKGGVELGKGIVDAAKGASKAGKVAEEADNIGLHIPMGTPGAARGAETAAEDVAQRAIGEPFNIIYPKGPAGAVGKGVPETLVVNESTPTSFLSDIFKNADDTAKFKTTAEGVTTPIAEGLRREAQAAKVTTTAVKDVPAEDLPRFTAGADGITPTEGRVVEEVTETVPSDTAKLPVEDAAPLNAAEVGFRQDTDPLAMSAREAQGSDKLREAFNTADKAPTLAKAVDHILASVGKKADDAGTLNDFIAKHPNRDLGQHQLVGDGAGKRYTVKQLNNVIAGELAANGGKLTARGQSAYQVLKQAHEANAQPVTDALQAYAARQQVLSEGLKDAIGPELTAVLDTKNSASSMTKALKAVQEALSPETDLHTFFSQHPQLGNALHSDLDIPKDIRPMANVAEDLERADGFLVAPRDAFGRPLNETPVQQAFREAMDEEVGKAAGEKFSVGNGKVRFTSHDPKTRWGKWWNQSNTYTQYTLYNKLERVIADRVNAISGKKELYGATRAKAFRDAIDSVQDDLSRSIQDLGIPLNIGVGKQELLPISFPEIYRLVSVKGFGLEGQDLGLLSLYNGGSRVAPTVLMQITHMAVQAGDLQALGREGVLQLRRDMVNLVLNPQKAGVKGALEGIEGKLPNNIRAMLDKDSTREYMPKGYVYAPNQKKAAQAMSNRLNKLAGYDSKANKIRVVQTKGGAWQIVTTRGALIPALVDAVIKAQPRIAERIAENASALAARSVDEASKLANTAKDAVKAAVEADVPGKELVHVITTLPKTVDDAALEIGALKRSVDAAVPFARAQVGTSLVEASRVAEQLGKDLRDPAVSYARSFENAAQKNADNVAKEFEEVAEEQARKMSDEPFDAPSSFADEYDDLGRLADDVDDIPEGPYRDISSTDTADLNQGILEHGLFGLISKFNQYYGVQHIKDLQEASFTMSNNWLRNVGQQWANLARKYPKNDATLNEAFNALKAGGEVPAHLSEAAAEMSRILDNVLPVGEKGVLDSALLRNEGSVKNINAALKLAFSDSHLAKTPEFDYGFARQEAAEMFGVSNPTGEQIAEAMAQQWKTWETGTDPLDFVSRVTTAAATVQERKMFATSFVNRFEREGLASTTPKPGMVKITASGESAFRSYLPETLYVDKDLAGELHRLDALVRTSTQLHGELGDAVRKYFLPVQNMWKSNITVMRPGHHIRNFVGDSSITWMSRGNRGFVQAYKDTQRVLGWKNNYTEMDLVENMRRLEGGEFKLPEGGEVLFRGSGRWEGTDMTVEGAHQLMQQAGLLSTYSRAEDLLTDATKASAVTKLTNKLSFEGTKVKEVAGGVSEYTAHMGRGQHFMQAMRQELSGKGKYQSVKNFDELVQKVAREVKRAHPDGSMLTTFEKKYLRVIIPFYSWFGKTLPYALEATLRHPGRFMVMPKASYNLAVSMGINPDTLSNPFPTDQMFPSFLTGGFFGPQLQVDGKYVNINPGFAVTDVFGSIGQNPIRGALGMVSPLLRVPAELATGSSMQTGSKINDTSDYLDQNIPFLNYIANMTGVSPTGSVASLAKGEGLDPQLQVERGNKDGFDQALTFSNWLTGMNAQNWSRPNYINYAEIEKRNRAAEEKK